MPAPRRLLALLLALLLGFGAGLPAHAAAQGAGDEQYQDPLAGEEPPSTGSGEPEPPAAEQPDTSTSSEPPAEPAPAPEPPPGAEPAPEPAGEPAPAGVEAESGPVPSAREGGELPRTGGDPVLAAALGAALLAAGTGLRARGRRPDGAR